ncbi:MAG: helix-turn-helix transcriptional regulator [Caulobacteraceae bacterium]|nr:helix-turn-helix transcriptional regulator [Caulobacter sp.]
MEAPPRAGPELGGGRAAAGDAVDAALEALLDLCADRPWREVSLRDVAERAGVSFAALYARAPGKAALLGRLSDRYDREALRAVDGDPQPEAHDRLFEAFMARLDVLGARRDVLIAIGRAEPLLVSRSFGRTARALAEAAGVDTTGGRGALRLLALTGVWARTLQVWRDDEGALNRTMAEIDKRLREASRRLGRVGAGF